MTETDLMRRIQVRASKLGWRLFRNNVGVLKDANGQYVRYGLCPGSSDLIGWKPGGIFTAIEVKTSVGRATDEQLAFIAAVNRMGGYAKIARAEDDL